MFDENSRYHGIETAIITLPSGASVSYVRRRFLPHPQAIPALGMLATDSEERLDRLAAQALGDPEQYWRLCDVNYAMNPRQLVQEHRGPLTVPQPYIPDPDGGNSR